MINNDGEFDLITSFQESVEESEKTSIGKALELIPDDEDETVPEQYLIRYDCLLQQTIKRTFEEAPEKNDGVSLQARDIYYREVSKIRVLTQAEETEIAKKAFEGDQDARDLLVKHNLRLVAFIAKNYLRYGVDFEDLIQEGNMGLIRAAEKYDYRKPGYSPRMAFTIFLAFETGYALDYFIVEDFTSLVPCYYREWDGYVKINDPITLRFLGNLLAVDRETSVKMAAPVIAKAIDEKNS